MTTLSAIITPTNLVTATSTETLTNKTLTAPTIASANLTTALTLAGAAGTNGQVMTSAGSGLPSWTTPSSGALVFISSQTVTTAVASVDFTSGIDATYEDYQIIISGITPSANDAYFRLFLYQSSAFSTSYAFGGSAVNLGGGYFGSVDDNFARIGVNTPSLIDTSVTWGGNFLLQNVNSALARKPLLIGHAAAMSNNGNYISAQYLAGASNTAAVVRGFRVAFSVGNVTAGTFRLYGIKPS